MKFLKLFEDIDTKNGLYRLPEDHANEIKDILSGIADEGYEYHVTIYTPHGIKIESDEVCYFLLVHYLDIEYLLTSPLIWINILKSVQHGLIILLVEKKAVSLLMSGVMD